VLSYSAAMPGGDSQSRRHGQTGRQRDGQRGRERERGVGRGESGGRQRLRGLQISPSADWNPHQIQDQRIAYDGKAANADNLLQSKY